MTFFVCVRVCACVLNISFRGGCGCLENPAHGRQTRLALNDGRREDARANRMLISRYFVRLRRDDWMFNTFYSYRFRRFLHRDTHTHTARQFLGETDFQLRVLLLWGSSAFSPVGRNDLLLSSKKKKTKNIPPPVAFDPYRPNSIRVCVYIYPFSLDIYIFPLDEGIPSASLQSTGRRWCESGSVTHTHTQQTNSDHRLLLGSLSLSLTWWCVERLRCTYQN